MRHNISGLLTTKLQRDWFGGSGMCHRLVCFSPSLSRYGKSQQLVAHRQIPAHQLPTIWAYEKLSLWGWSLLPMLTPATQRMAVLLSRVSGISVLHSASPGRQPCHSLFDAQQVGWEVLPPKLSSTRATSRSATLTFGGDVISAPFKRKGCWPLLCGFQQLCGLGGICKQ